MEILIGAIVLAVGLVAAAALFTRRAPGFAAGAVAAPPAASPKREAAATPVATTTDVAKSAERGADLLRLEERVRAREEAVESRLSQLGDRERLLADKTSALEEAREQQILALERVAGMSASQARQQLLKELEDQTRHDRA